MRVRGPSQVTTIGSSLGAWSAITLAATPETASRSLRAAPVLPWVSRSTIAVHVWCASRWGVLLNVRRATVVMAADLPGCGQPWPCALRPARDRESLLSGKGVSVRVYLRG